MQAAHYALILGNSLYDHLDDLKTPVVDATAVSRTLEDPTIGDYECQVHLNQESYRLRLDIASFLKKAKREDTILLYFSGHGLIDDDGQFYLATKDTDPSYPAATSISARFIAREMENCNADRKIIILDSCHSGAFIEGFKSEGELDVGRRLRAELGRGVAILAASGQLQYAFQGEKLSAFSQFLVEGLEKGLEYPQNELLITVNRLYKYIDWCLRENDSEQRVQINNIRQEGEIAIAYNLNASEFTLPVDVDALLDDGNDFEIQRSINFLKDIAKGEDEFKARKAVRQLQKLAHHSSQKIKGTSAKVLEELDRGIKKPRIRFSTGKQISSVREWVAWLEDNAARKYWLEASEFLYSGILEGWLEQSNQLNFAKLVQRISSEPGLDRLVGLEQFQRIAGNLPAQNKADAETNLNELLGEFIYWRLRRKRRPKEFEFKVANQGRGYLHGTLRSKVPWIDIEQPEFGCLPNNTAAVKITVLPKEFKIYGIYGFPLSFTLH